MFGVKNKWAKYFAVKNKALYLTFICEDILLSPRCFYFGDFFCPFQTIYYLRHPALADSGCGSHGFAAQPNEYKTSQPPEGRNVPESNIRQGELMFGFKFGPPPVLMYWGFFCKILNSYLLFTPLFVQFFSA